MNSPRLRLRLRWIGGIVVTRDKLLFTPGPLTTSATVKAAMSRDIGSRDREMIGVIRDIRAALLRVAGVSPQLGFETVLLPGSGTYAVEAVLSSVAPPDGHWLIVVNGAYGKRMAQIAAVHGIAHTVLEVAENQRPDPAAVDAALHAHPDVTGVAVVHCETTTGILNPIDQIGTVVKRHGKVYVVDSMSAFGGVGFDLAACQADFLISSANKCLEGAPGMAFVLCRRSELRRTRGWARTLSLDLYDQWCVLEETGQFRFTPPTHVLLALKQALDELAEEGGVSRRAARYRSNHETLVHGMRRLGFEEYLPPELQSDIITSFRWPRDARFTFEALYDELAARGFVIYPGKVSCANCFRIGTIGRIFPGDVVALLGAVESVIEQLRGPSADGCYARIPCTT
jgi:2-aminoethylphosphonate-pyruvate transaminase